MAKTLSTEPLIDPSASLRETRLGAYCEVGARTVLHDVEIGDYSHVVNDSQMSYTTIGKSCSIAAMKRIALPGGTGITRPLASPVPTSAGWPSRHFWINMRRYPLPRVLQEEVLHRDRYSH